MIYISTNCLKGKDFIFIRDVFNVLEIYRQLGIKNIELGSVHSGAVDINKLKKYKKENNVSFIVHGFFPPAKKHFILNLASQHANTVKNTLKFMKNSIEVCNTIEADLYGFHPGYTSEIGLDFKAASKPYPYEKVLETAIANIQILADYAASYNTKIAVENQSTLKETTKIFYKKEEFERLFKATKNAGLLLDVGHLHFAAKKQSDKNRFIKDLKDKIFEIHIQKPGKDYDDHLKIDEKTVNSVLKYFGKNEIKKIKLTLESVRLTQKDILECIEILKKINKKSKN